MYYVSKVWLTGRWYIGIIGSEVALRYFDTEGAARRWAADNFLRLI